MAQGALGAAGVRRVWAGAGLRRIGAGAYRGGHPPTACSTCSDSDGLWTSARKKTGQLLRPAFQGDSRS